MGTATEKDYGAIPKRRMSPELARPERGRRVEGKILLPLGREVFLWIILLHPNQFVRDTRIKSAIQYLMRF